VRAHPLSAGGDVAILSALTALVVTLPMRREPPRRPRYRF
jgi:hypothetical protein